MTVPAFLTNLNTLSIIAFILLAVFLLWRDRENIERHSIVFVRRTKEGVHILDRVARINPRLWNIWATLGVVVGFVIMVPMFVLILHQTLKLFLVADAVVPVQPLLPTASTFTNPAQAGYFGIPFWYFMVSISVVLVVHEMMHGVIARVEDFNVEYVGLILIGILPGAFVQPEGQKDFFEPEEGEDDAEAEEGSQSPWDQGSWIARLRVLAAGPWANITLALLLGLLVFGAPIIAAHTLGPMGIVENEGVPVLNVSPGSPAEQAGLASGMLITGINGNDTYTTTAFTTEMNRYNAGDTVTVRTATNGTFDVTLTGPEQRSGENVTYRPALIDRFLPRIEKEHPGTIDWYEAHNNWVVAEDKRLELLRWRWIQENHPALETTAEQRIQELESDIGEQPQRGLLGITIQGIQEMDIKYGLEALLPVVQILYLLLYVVGLINLAIGTANLLPVKGLDGGWMLSILLERFVPEKEPRITRWVTVTTILLIAISFAFFLVRVLL